MDPDKLEEMERRMAAHDATRTMDGLQGAAAGSTMVNMSSSYSPHTGISALRGEKIMSIPYSSKIDMYLHFLVSLHFVSSCSSM